jgi:hypothetical protein
MAGRDSQADERKALSACRRASPGYDVWALAAVSGSAKGMIPAAPAKPLAPMTLTAGDRRNWRRTVQLGARPKALAIRLRASLASQDACSGVLGALGVASEPQRPSWGLGGSFRAHSAAARRAWSMARLFAPKRCSHVPVMGGQTLRISL